jgi:signal peptidase II
LTTSTEAGPASVVARLAGPVVAAAAVLALDQATKALIVDVVMQPARVIAITPFFNLTLGYNRGISFGLFDGVLSGVPMVLSIVLLMVAAGILWMATRSRCRVDQIALGAIAGGAVGNALDRVRQGAVTDFLDFHAGGWHWPTFNLADVAICIGAVLLAARAFATPKDTPQHNDRARGT